MAAKSSAHLFEYDVKHCGCGEVAGADEAGRGCLAGPLAAAAVVFDYSSHDSAWFARALPYLNDSKKLSAAARERLYPLIIRHAALVTLVVTGNQTIDREGLHAANLRSLCRSVEMLKPQPQAVLVDGRQNLPECSVEHRPVTGGDRLSACIAAASIVAKVNRDRLMRRLHEVYPQYGFDSHVGYATEIHRRAIARHGLCPLHRRSFRITPLNDAEAEAG